MLHLWKVRAVPRQKGRTLNEGRVTLWGFEFADEKVEEVGGLLLDHLLQQLFEEAVDVMSLQVFLRLLVGLDLFLAIHSSYNYNLSHSNHHHYLTFDAHSLFACVLEYGLGSLCMGNKSMNYTPQ